MMLEKNKLKSKLFEESFDFDIPYLTHQIIPYIGNKRKLLTLIYSALKLIFGENFRGKRFLDPFAGSGVVSRLAKYLGFEVDANDWEPYSYVINYAYLTINKSDLENLYYSMGGIDVIISHLNNPESVPEGDQYIARFYSPKSDDNPDYRKERLFYTRSNGLTIDRIRNELERLYPKDDINSNEELMKEKNLLLAILLYQAATHTNTSGVFKAYHKGFGGFSGDALSRILKPISMERPVLIDSLYTQRVFCEDANVLVTSGPLASRFYDVVYLDPPYNQHQYGSNYHMLNTIALWDKPLLHETSGNDCFEKAGGGAGKAAIRRDWIKTRSDYCYRDRATAAFMNLISSLETDHIIVSYSTEGIIPFEELIRICSTQGRVSLITNEYVKYPGGKQSIKRVSHNIEFVIVVERGKKMLVSDLELVQDAIQGRKLNLQLKSSYVRERLFREFIIDRDRERIGYTTDGYILWLQTLGFFKICEYDLNSKIEGLSLPEGTIRRLRNHLLVKLRLCECGDKVEELDEVIKAASQEKTGSKQLVSFIPGILRKMAHKKYKALFYSSMEKVKEFCKRYPEKCYRIEKKLTGLEELAMKRFSG